MNILVTLGSVAALYKATNFLLISILRFTQLYETRDQSLIPTTKRGKLRARKMDRLRHGPVQHKDTNPTEVLSHLNKAFRQFTCALGDLHGYSDNEAHDNLTDLINTTSVSLYTVS